MGIDELHERGVMHGDLSSGKVEFFTTEHKWKLTCLGCPEILLQPLQPQCSSTHGPAEPGTSAGDNVTIPARRAFDRWCYILVLFDVLAGEARLNDLVERQRNSRPSRRGEFFSHLFL